jgi:hypothetical protein
MLTRHAHHDNARDMETKTPTLKVEITKENYEQAIQASSGSCLVADAIKKQHPNFSSVKVDVATIRFSDKERGERYLYLTPPSVYQTLLFFDQGWQEAKLPKTLRIRTPLKIIPITRSASDVKLKAERRAARLAQLEAKEKSGKRLTGLEKRSIERLRNPKQPTVRPLTHGSRTTEVVQGGEIVVRSGPGRVPVKTHKTNPNLLAGHDRHFGAKQSKPSQVFRQAVEEAVKVELAKRKDKKS